MGYDNALNRVELNRKGKYNYGNKMYSKENTIEYRRKILCYQVNK